MVVMVMVKYNDNDGIINGNSDIVSGSMVNCNDYDWLMMLIIIHKGLSRNMNYHSPVSSFCWTKAWQGAPVVENNPPRLNTPSCEADFAKQMMNMGYLAKAPRAPVPPPVVPEARKVDPWS